MSQTPHHEPDLGPRRSALFGRLTIAHRADLTGSTSTSDFRAFAPLLGSARPPTPATPTATPPA
jgi:hypothetical protein